jgi:excisionase family DNA binding protein
MDLDKFHTLPEFSDITGISLWHARGMANRGELPVVRVGRRYRISAAALRSWIDAAGRGPVKPQAKARKTAAA